MLLLGREGERLALDRLLTEARDGRSGVVALVGEAGIGKTSLLEYAVDEAVGMQILRARGVESESEVPFAGLAELLRPALPALDRIPAPQAQALSGALALAPATAQDRFAVGAATLSLLSAYSDEGPVALFVDDAHLLDGSSADALLFAARRLVADSIAVVLTVREGEASLLDGADLRVLRVAGLGRTDAVELLRRADVGAETAERLFAATGGNPLALLELAPDAARLAAAPADAPLPISTRIGAAFARRLQTLSEPTRRMLLLAAAGDSRDVAALARAATMLGLDFDLLATAEEEGLVHLEGGRVEFRHPLVRSAVYTDATPKERREAHGALAAALPDRDVDQRAWHLAAASVGPNDQAAAALEQAGERGRRRSAYAVAAEAFESAARLSPAAADRVRLLFEAAESSALAGLGRRALELLEEIRPAADEPPLSARIDHLRGLLTIQRGPISEGVRLIVGAAEQLADADPERAVVMLADAVHGSFYAGDTATMVAAARRSGAVADGLDSPRATFFARLAEAMAFVADGQGDAGAAAARAAARTLETSAELRDDPQLLAWAVVPALYLRDASGRTLIDLAEQARRQAAVGALPRILHNLARDQATTDQWAAAEANYDEAISLARETGQRAEIAGSLAGIAWLEARMGREVQCRRHAAEAAAMCDDVGMGTYSVWTIQALGDLELGLGRPDAAVEHYEQQVAALRARGIADVDLSPAPELVDAYLRLGRAGDAAQVAAAFVAAAEAKGQPWALARAFRCRGMLAEGDELDACFERALELHERTPDAFEAARTRLAYGARLRRARKRLRAREELRAAIEIFHHLGSEPWAAQASAELAASGETARRRDATTLDELTPQEIQIARQLADGKTTREAAAAIFLSPKTVEYHLRNVYRKLGINSREELAAALKVTSGA